MQICFDNLNSPGPSRSSSEQLPVPLKLYIVNFDQEQMNRIFASILIRNFKYLI